MKPMQSTTAKAATITLTTRTWKSEGHVGFHAYAPVLHEREAAGVHAPGFARQYRNDMRVLLPQFSPTFRHCISIRANAQNASGLRAHEDNSSRRFAMRSFALLLRGLRATSSAFGTMGLRVMISSIGLFPHTQTGRSGGQVQPLAYSLKVSLTMRSSSE